MKHEKSDIYSQGDAHLQTDLIYSYASRPRLVICMECKRLQSNLVMVKVDCLCLAEH